MPDTPDRSRRARARRGEGDRLRGELLRAAETLLDEGGEGAVTVRAVANTVGVSLPAVYLHFASQADLLHAVCLQVWDDLERRMRDASTAADGPLEELRRRGAAYIRFGLEHAVRYRLVASGPSVDATSRIADACYHTMCDTVRRCMDTDRLRGDATALTRAVCACLHGAVSLLILQPRSRWPEDVEAFAEDMATVATQGVVALSRAGSSAVR
ncbi:TetR/AcrR family transcriptional regulator [Streptomyces sp. NPDC049936]|uniref:TetR/AcrR family transcriptional regulator n=1 Tax=Streptomyces sp. NPDC049936 TaxID=3365599 RepID=UPI00379E12A5